jgi:hypothetical protein
MSHQFASIARSIGDVSKSVIGRGVADRSQVRDDPGTVFWRDWQYPGFLLRSSRTRRRQRGHVQI